MDPSGYVQGRACNAMTTVSTGQTGSSPHKFQRVSCENRIDIEGRLRKKNLLETIGMFRPTDMFSSLCFAWCHSFGESWFFQAFEI